MVKQIGININGKEIQCEVRVGESLLDLLRRRGLKGSKKGCGVGECGACTVLVDGENIDSCIYLAVWADGRDIQTVEGLESEGTLSAVQEAFVAEGAVQCGFCTPGLIMTTTGLVDKKEKPNRDELRRMLSGHLCRCTGYQNILNAAEQAMSENND